MWGCVVTVRVTALKGPDAGVYYVEALPSYYLDAGEPPGVWLGDAAGTLGLSGDVDDDAFIALMAGMDPRQPDRPLGRLYDERSVRGYDVTCSAPKTSHARSRQAAGASESGDLFGHARCSS